MICSSLNLLRLIPSDLFASGSTQNGHTSGSTSDCLFALTRLDPSQWKAARTTNAIERLNEEFRRRIKTQTALPCADTVPMLLWALLASGQIIMRKVDGRDTLPQPINPFTLDQAA